MDDEGSGNKGHDAIETMRRFAWTIAGTAFLALGIVGIVLPLLPTTPFLLLAAACYSRGSKRFHRWLLSSRIFGDYIRAYQEGRPLTTRAFVLMTVTLWALILFSALFMLDDIFLRSLLILVAVIVTIHLFRLHDR